MEEQLSDQAKLLNKYLMQYKIIINQKRMLIARGNEIRREFESPLSAISYSGMPKVKGEKRVGCASLSFRMADIEEKLLKQVEQAEKKLLNIWNIIDFLPEGTLERIILEHRYIDRMSWEKICRAVSISRTPATRYWRKGLNDLLKYKKVQAILEEFKRQQDYNE